MRLLLFVLVVFVVHSSHQRNLDQSIQHCDPFYNCFLLRMFSNLTDIVESDVYPLTSNLFLEKVSNISENNFVYDIVPKLEKYNSDPWRLTQLLMAKTAKIFETHSLRWTPSSQVAFKVYPIVTSKGNRAVDAALELSTGVSRDGRTFGARRKMMMALLPMMYKLGVITTLLTVLTVLVLKGLGVGVVLMILGVGNLFGKLYSAKQAGYEPSGHGWQPSKEVHVHVHNNPHHTPHTAWDRSAVTEYYNPYSNGPQRTPYPYMEYPYHWGQ